MFYLLPLIALIAILSRRSWARIYNLVLGALFGLAMIFIVVEMGPTNISWTSGETLAVSALILLLISLWFWLLQSSSARYFPDHNPQNTQLDPNCLATAVAAFETFVQDNPDRGLRILRDEGHTALAMVIPLQPGIQRNLLLDLQHNQVLNLSIGALWMTWRPCQNSEQFQQALSIVQGLFDGNCRVIEQLKDNRMVRGRVQQRTPEGWVNLKDWKLPGAGASSGLQEKIWP